MDIYLDKVTLTSKDTLYKLLQYSLFEESETDKNEMNDDALFEYKWFDNYFTDDDRIAYFVKEQGSDKLLGFVMINSYLQHFNLGKAIAEFMIIPKYRRQKIGSKVAKMCFDMYKGNWEVSPCCGSERAFNFWKNVIDSYTNGNYEIIDGLFVFSN